MKSRKPDFTKALEQCEEIVKEMGLKIVYTHDLDRFFKGDLNGKIIYISDHLHTEEKLFNLLHLAGHCVQWNTDPALRRLGSELYLNPGDKLLNRLQAYEWQANCYALYILRKAGVKGLDRWLRKKYVTDMMYLTHFYKTGKKLKRITRIAEAYPFKRELRSKLVPLFTPKASSQTRNGLVINF